jgi:hypothetical protein
MIAWTPDGKSIPFTMTRLDAGFMADRDARAARGHGWTEAPRIIESLNCRSDRRGDVIDVRLRVYPPRARLANRIHRRRRVRSIGGAPGHERADLDAAHAGFDVEGIDERVL